MRNDWRKKQRKLNSTGRLQVETLEDKVCLTASVAMTDGNLLVAGDADGPIEIKLNDAQELQITDNGVVLGAFSEVVNLDIDLDGGESADPGTVNLSLFMDGALAEEPSIVECTLIDGSTTECYEITVVGTPVNQDVGPFCPTSITDDEEAGGLWLDGENSYVIDGEFFTELAEIYGDDLWDNIYNEDGSINVIDTAEAFQAAARPNVPEQYFYHCVDGKVEWLDGGVQPTVTIQVPVTPVQTDAVTVEFAEAAHSNLGVTLNGAGLSGSADATAILDAYTIAAFDDCGGHINPALGYHVHGTTGCSDVTGDVPDGETAPFAIAIDGHTVHAPHDDEDDVELDECNGHYSDEYGYHYHANPLEENATLTCLMGLIVEGQDGGGGPPGGGPPGGGPPGGGPPADEVPDEVADADEGVSVVAAAAEGDHSPDNTVVLDVGSYELNDVNVGLGSGTNSFTFASGEVEGTLLYLGLESDGGDTVIFQAASTVEGNVILELGDGADFVELHGEIEGDIEVHGDGGDDSATVGVTGDVDGVLWLEMGGGTNSFTNHGEIGELYYFGGAAEDAIALTATSEVQTDARVSVDAGENTINVLGDVDGTLTVVSANDAEEVAIDENASVGTLTINLGVEDDHGHDHGEDDHTHVEASDADFDEDGTVGFGDFLILADSFGVTATEANSHIDLDQSGTIDFADFTLFSSVFGMTVEDTTEATGVNVDLFLDEALAEEPTIVDCALSDGTESQCYEITVVGEPVDQEVGPFCPTTTSATDEEGGIWFDGESLYDIDGQFILDLAELYDDPNWLLYNEDGTVNVTDTLEAFEGAARPDVAEEYQNHCVEGRLEWLEDGHYIPTTVTIPVEPVPVETPIVPGNWGVTLNGVNIAASAPVDAILGAYTIAAFDDNGGHFNPVDGYHLHGVVDGSGTSVVEGHSNMIGYALDGYAIYAPLEEGHPDLAELDECNGHTTDGIGYHYHANPAEENSVLTCLTGAIVGNVGGPGGGGPPGGGPPAGAEAAALIGSAGDDDGEDIFEADLLDMVVDDLVDAMLG